MKLINNAIFGKTMETVTKHKDIKPVTTEASRNYLVSEPNYSTKNLLAIEMRKMQILMNKPCLFESLNTRTEQNSNVWVLLWFLKSKYGKNVKLCFMETESFIVHVKTDDIYKNKVEDVETKFYTWSYELNKPLHHLKIKK